jgi:hypothetical protein
MQGEACCEWWRAPARRCGVERVHVVRRAVRCGVVRCGVVQAVCCGCAVCVQCAGLCSQCAANRVRRSLTCMCVTRSLARPGWPCVLGLISNAWPAGSSAVRCTRAMTGTVITTSHRPTQPPHHRPRTLRTRARHTSCRRPPHFERATTDVPADWALANRHHAPQSTEHNTKDPQTPLERHAHDSQPPAVWLLLGQRSGMSEDRCVEGRLPAGGRRNSHTLTCACSLCPAVRRSSCQRATRTSMEEI